jgi:signal transduction histidine kinase
VQKDTIYMPPEIQDVMRDLIANARKYTDTGGRIDASLSQTETELELVIEDNGRGIPEDQIESTIDYGFRGTNVDDKKSYGGGFGLTKAYYITKRYGGRMWIESALEVGTKITIRIPLPQVDQAGASNKNA